MESQVELDPHVVEVLRKWPDVLERRLLPLEEEIRTGWKYDPGKFLYMVSLRRNPNTM